MSNAIEDLEPVTRGMCQQFLADTARAGIKLRVTHTLRTMDEQLHLYAKGRQKQANGTWLVVDKRAIVTKAAPGASPHNWGMAFDVCFDSSNPFPPPDDPRWRQIGIIAEAIGLNWGGPLGANDRFTWDAPHFERKNWKAYR